MTKLFRLLNDYANAFTTGQKPSTTGTFDDLQGRFIRMAPGQPDALTDDPDRRIVFLVDGTTLTDLIGLTGYQVCMAVGWDPDYTKGKVNAGYRFALAVFPKQNCKLGTWDNVLDAVIQMYPEIAGKIAKHRAALRQMTPASLAQMEQRLGYTLLSVDQTPGAKKSDARYMTIDRYRSAPDTLESARAFLYFTVHIKELFYGDGYTRTKQGQKGVEEYIMPAMPMTDLREHKVLPIQVQVPRVAIHTRPPKAGELPLPSFFNPDNAAEWGYQPLLQSFLPSQPPGLFDVADQYRQQHKVKPAATDAHVVTLVPIDMQLDFCHPSGTLYVGGRSGNGAIEDCAKVAQLIYRDAARITRIIPSLDTHFAYQIFFASFWQTRDGGKVGCHRTVTTDQIRKGEVVPAPAMAKWLCSGNYPWLQRQVLHYCESLEAAGKYELYLWPPHCILGLQGHALNGVVAEAMLFHAYLRHAQMSPEIKGGHPLTENYSILRPEVLTRFDGKPLAQKNADFIKTLLTSDAVILAGEASSHCVASTIDDLLHEILAQDPSLARKCYVLADCMSAVVVPGGRDFTPEADAALARFKAAGMHVVSSTTPMSDWPDFPGN